MLASSFSMKRRWRLVEIIDFSSHQQLFAGSAFQQFW
jgi:hypothetical protein